MAVSASLVINEIYLSLQGESTFAGLPCVFIRTTGCNLRCSYCDTAYAFTEGRRWPLSDAVARVHELAQPFIDRGSAPTLVSGAAVRWPIVELTGGEPLLQAGSLTLMRQLCDQGFTVLLETSGAVDIVAVDPRVRRIVDLKCPSSGECNRRHAWNLEALRATDEVKFVIGTEEDYDWAKHMVAKHSIPARCPVLFSWASPLGESQRHATLKPVPPGLTPLTKRGLAERIVADALPVRFQLQMHKAIWPVDERGV